MNDELSELYMEAVRNPKSKTKADVAGNKKGRTGNLEAGQDFGFSEKGTQKGTGPDSAKGITKPKKAAKTLTEDTEEDSEGTDKGGSDETPTIGSKFDELFSSTITEEFGEAGHPGMQMSMGSDDSSTDMSDGMPSDDMTDDTSDEVSLKSELTLIVGRLQEILDNIEGDDESGDEGEGHDIEDLETSSNDGMQGARPFGEASANAQGKGDPGMDMKRDGVLRKAKDFDKSFQKPTGDNKVSGYYGNKTMKSGPGETGMTKPRDGVLRKAPDFDKSLQGKNNKVSTSSVMSKPGANLFD